MPYNQATSPPRVTTWLMDSGLNSTALAPAMGGGPLEEESKEERKKKRIRAQESEGYGE